MDMATENKKGKKNQFPSGIVLRLCKYVNSSIAQKFSGQAEDEVEERTHFAFGNFDFINFRPVEKFADYYSESSRGRLPGHRQDVMLYALSEKEDRSFGFVYDGEDQKPCFCAFQEGKQVKRNFLVISMLYVSATVKDYFSDYRQFLSYCKSAIRNIVRSCNTSGDGTPVVCEVFGTFNSSEVAIFWGTDRFPDIQYIVDHISYLSFQFKTKSGYVPGSAFVSTYSIIASSDTDFHVEYDFIYSDSLPILEQFYKAFDNSSGDTKEFRNEFGDYFSRGTTYTSYREHDVSAYLQKLDWAKLLQVDVDTSDCADNMPASRESKDVLEAKRVNRQKRRQESINLFLSKIREGSVAIGHTSNFYYELLRLESDYIQCVSTLPDDKWAMDFQEQYSSAIQILDYLFSVTFDSKINALYLENSQTVIGVLQHQIRHISDVGKPFFKEPYSHLESTGRYELLFHMYYGVVKEILVQMYQLREPFETEDQHQHELVPIMCFRPVQIIDSRLFFSIPIDKRLVDISMPYDAWCEPCFYMPFLVHELYHYVVPVDRVVRNRLFAIILTAEITVTAFYCWLSVLARRKAYAEQLEGIAAEVLITGILPFLRQGIIAFLYDAAISSPTVGNNGLQWKDYEHELVEWVFGSPEEDRDRLFALLRKAPWADIFARCEAAFTGEATKESMKLLCGAMLHLIESPSPADSALFDYFQNEAIENWKPMIVQLRELFPDLAMVSFTGAKVCDYLMLFAFAQEKLGNAPQNLAESELYLRYRIGFILDWIFGSFDKDTNGCMSLMKDSRKEFLVKYEAYMNNSNWRFDKTAMQNAEKSADNWFNFFEMLYSDYLENCSSYRPILEELGKQQFSPLCTVEGPIKELCSNYFSMLSSTREKAENKEFQQCIGAIQAFQKQPLLEDILTEPRPRGRKSQLTDRCVYCYPKSNTGQQHAPIILNTDCASMLTWSIYTASKHLERCHRDVFGTDTCKLWYRGSQNADFAILPSIMVHFFDNLGSQKAGLDGRNAVGTLWEYQRSILERFKYQADGSVEFINPSSYLACDYMALMQHYGQYTTYLDWSESAYTALYFALEDYILDSKVKQYEGKCAALYVMDPMLYNRARRKLVQKADAEHPEEFCPNDTWYHMQSRFIQEMQEGHIPNLSISYNKRRYGIFSFDVPVEEDVNISREISCLKCTRPPNEATLADFPLEMWNLPLAVYTSRLNPRVQAQSGMFLAFSPFALPSFQNSLDVASKPSVNNFSYLSLLNIQKHFLNEFPGELPFIYEIRIQSYVKAAVGEQLRLAGIDKYRIYPELGNLDLGL